jgi:hypothetical protein
MRAPSPLIWIVMSKPLKDWTWKYYRFCSQCNINVWKLELRAAKSRGRVKEIHFTIEKSGYCTNYFGTLVPRARKLYDSTLDTGNRWLYKFDRMQKAGHQVLMSSHLSLAGFTWEKLMLILKIAMRNKESKDRMDIEYASTSSPSEWWLVLYKVKKRVW